MELDCIKFFFHASISNKKTAMINFSVISDKKEKIFRKDILLFKYNKTKHTFQYISKIITKYGDE